METKHAIIKKHQNCTGWEISHQIWPHEIDGKIQEVDWREITGSDYLSELLRLSDYIRDCEENETEPAEYPADTQWVLDDSVNSGTVEFFADYESAMRAYWEIETGDWTYQAFTVEQAKDKLLASEWPTIYKHDIEQELDSMDDDELAETGFVADNFWQYVYDEAEPGTEAKCLAEIILND